MDGNARAYYAFRPSGLIAGSARGGPLVVTDARCHRCDRSLLGDSERWLVCVNVTADFEPDLAALGRVEDPEIAIPRLLATLEASDEPPEDEIHKELAFVLCARCRVQWMANPLGAGPNGEHRPSYLLH